MKKKNHLKTKYNSDTYLEYIRGTRCCSCGAYPVDAHHEGIFRTGGTKRRNDFQAVPLCHDKCHLNGVHAEGKKFWDNRGLDPEWIVLTLLRDYRDTLKPSQFADGADYDREIEIVDELIPQLAELFDE